MKKYAAANELLVTTWIRYQQFGALFERESDYWAVVKLDQICKQDLPQAVDIIVTILERVQSLGIIEALANGPLNDLLSHHGETALSQLQQAATGNSKLASLLRSLQP